MSTTLATPHRTVPTRLTAAKLVTGADVTWTAFPEVGGYEAHHGPCSSSATTPSEPGSSATVELPFSPITVHLHPSNDSLPVKAQNQAVSVTWLPPTGTCVEALTYTVRTPTTCSGPAPANSASACTVKLAVPAGTWRFAVAAQGRCPARPPP